MLTFSTYCKPESLETTLSLLYSLLLYCNTSAGCTSGATHAPSFLYIHNNCCYVGEVYAFVWGKWMKRSSSLIVKAQRLAVSCKFKLHRVYTGIRVQSMCKCTFSNVSRFSSCETWMAWHSVASYSEVLTSVEEYDCKPRKTITLICTEEEMLRLSMKKKW